MDNKRVTLYEHPTTPYTLLTPTYIPPRSGPRHARFVHASGIDSLIQELSRASIIAFDFETRGNDPTHIHDPDPELRFSVVGLGLAWDTGSCYTDWGKLSTAWQRKLVRFLVSEGCPQLVAHNTYFDQSVLYGLTGKHPVRPPVCTLALYALLANESQARKWGLKSAQKDVLGWEETNEGLLDEWLILNGHYKGVRRKDESPENLIACYREGSLKPEKGEMWRAPAEILGHYCILDAESTYALYTGVLRPALRKHPEFESFYYGPWLHHIRTHIEQAHYGISVDIPALETLRAELRKEISETLEEFLAHPRVAPHVAAMEAEWLATYIREKEPKRYKKDGGVSKNWIRFHQNVDEIRAGRNPSYRFNINSRAQLGELFYKRLGLPVNILTEGGAASAGIRAFKLFRGDFHELGVTLVRRAELIKELEYVEKYIELASTREGHTLHPGFRLPGPITGRASANNPNILQIPKTKRMMGCFVSRPGRLFVDLDFAALEPVVSTEFSEDENLMRIYGEGAAPNDIYLFLAAHIPGISERVRATGYDPYNSTAETLAIAKKECKRDRSICKTVVLACNYGAGIGKVHQTLTESGIDISEDEVRLIHSNYWELFGGLRRFGRSLQSKRKKLRGWIPNGLGRPMAIPDEWDRDTLNRFIQSTGHDILVVYVSILCTLLDESSIEWKPIIADFHDACTVEVPEEHADRVASLFLEALDRLNGKLQGSIRLSGKPTVGRTLACVKEPEE